MASIGQCTSEVEFSASSQAVHTAETATAAEESLKIAEIWVGMPFAPVNGMPDRARIEALENRTRQFALEIAKLVRRIRVTPELRTASDQLNAAAGSVSANHRAVGRSRSTREFAAKLQIVNEEADEAAHWLSLLKETNRDASLREPIEVAWREAVELRNIFAKARSTTRSRYFSQQ